MSHIPHKSGHSPPESLSRPSHKTHKSRLPIKSENTRRPSQTSAVTEEAGLIGSPSLNATLTSGHDIDRTTNRAIRVSPPYGDRNLSWSSHKAPSRLTSRDPNPSKRPKGLAIRNSAVDAQADDFTTIGKCGDSEANVSRTDALGSDGSNTETKYANTSYGVVPLTSGGDPEAFTTPEHQSTSTTMSYHPSTDIPASGRIIPELRSLISATQSHYVPPSTPNVLATSTPSSRYSESPGVWSSRDTTPTSLSSYSPGLVQSMSPKRIFRSPKSSSQPSWSRKGQSSAGHEALMQADQSGQREMMVSNPPAELISPLSARTERHQSRKKRDNTAGHPPPTPPPRKSSTNFRSPEKRLKSSRKSSKSTRSNSTSSVAEFSEDLGTGKYIPDIQQVQENQRQQKPQRPSREGVVFLPNSTSDYSLSLAAGTVPSPQIASLSNNLSHPGHPAVHLEQNQGSRYHAGRRSATQGLFGHNTTTNTGNTTTSIVGGKRTTPAMQNPHSDNESGAEQLHSYKSDRKPGRFGFLGRKMKSTKHEPPAEKSTKTLRKGPATGTGHEGYGKWGFSRGRRLSTTGMQGQRGTSTSTSNSASRSVTSLKSNTSSGHESDMDDFLSQRLEPIILRGGGGPLGSHPSSSNGSQTSLSEASHQGLPSAQQPLSTLSISDNVSPAIATTRSLSSHDDYQEKVLPNPPNTSHELVADKDHTQSQPYSLDQTEKPKTSRWNLFSRNRKPTQRTADADVQPKMTVAVAPLHDTRPLAYYAMDDFGSDSENFEALEDSDEQDRHLSPAFNRSVSSSLRTPQHTLRRQQGYSVLLPSPPVRPSEFASAQRPPSPRVFFGQDHAREVSTEDMSRNFDKTPGLTQAGRAQGTSSQQDPRGASVVRSFSRPFGLESIPPKTEVSSSIQALTAADDFFNMATINTFPFGRSHTAPPKPTKVEENDDPDDIWDPSAGRELLDYSPNTAAEIPPPLTPKGRSINAAAPRIRHDEVWREYDDLIDHVLSPISGSKRTDSPFAQLSEPSVSALTQDPHRNYPNRVRSSQSNQKALQQSPATEHDYLLAFYAQPGEPFVSTSPLQTPSTLLPPLKAAKSSESVRLRRSRILSALHSSMTPSDPPSDHGLTECEENIMVSHQGLQLQRDSDFQESDDTSVLDLNNIAEEPETRTQHVSTVMLDIAERNRDGPIALSNLRYVALMTSRWLSFGRVLFSPAHDLLEGSTNSRLLIIDGLGNDDWSFYCALTYPNATIFNLSGRDPFLNSEARRSNWEAPVNHRNVSHTNLSEPFPFPGSFFAAIVFRYPVATSEQSLKRTISECKRVLQPGGYLEISVIDLDMVNMGNRTRRAIRMLKTRMNIAEPDVCLKPAGDNLQRLIGRRGFENLNRCIVNLPVAGAIGSLGSESSRASNGSSGRFSDASTSATSPDPSHKAKGINRARMSDQNFSLSDLIADHSSAGDEKLADVVAKVGRHFFSRCYEWAVLPDGNMERSVWSERAVLRECERRVTGFKLMIAYAQKPAENRRRTLSEPTKPTPAVIGTTMMKEYDRVMRR